jgi:carbamoyl-phosphate synthase large subunit
VKPRAVLVLGSGALQIGQAGEFDYSGSQALKALREEGIRTVLLNPNIATVQTSHELADEIYFLPVRPAFVEAICAREQIDAILLSFGGQTALDCGLALDASGALSRLGVRVLGTPIAAIRATEDRELFNAKLREIGVKVARSRHARSAGEAADAAREIGLPVILRAGFSLGGRGAAIVHDERDLVPMATRALALGGGVLVEECLSGWKEIEYEVMRDEDDNAITVCNMENVDPMGIHTGESIVVAPAQTLDDHDHQLLRDIALRTIRHLGIVGECNIQYALSPSTGDYRVIEVNARLSRSSALASKATGYPLAYVAAKVVLGRRLYEIPNAVTKVTTAFFEPALDYVVCKLPRWDFAKFEGAKDRIGPEMKSVGEVMAIGRTFAEALQKGARMLDIGASGVDSTAFAFEDVRRELSLPSSRRIFAVASALASGMSIDEVHDLSRIDRFFVGEIAEICEIAARLGRGRALPDGPLLREAKRAGFSDAQIARTVGGGLTERAVREARARLQIRPRLASIDTLAAEYPAQTSYLYFSYAADAHEIDDDPVEGADRPPTGPVLILGSGCYRIGSSVEFDWSCVGALRTCRELGRSTVLLNNNPETVSTDYDVCDRLVFDEISVETVLETVHALRPSGVIVSMGGQTANNLVAAIAREGVPILGTPAEAVDTAEDRGKFSALCDRLGIGQPAWVAHGSSATVEDAVDAVGGYPVVVRPSYVLSGAAMRIAHGPVELAEYVGRAAKVSPEYPVVISKFIEDAKEIELDAVAREGTITHWTVSEHIENAGVHSGDATLVLPPQHLYTETVRRVRRIGAALARALGVTGAFNVQFLAVENEVRVIECNLRASRSLPFVSKVVGVDFAREATRAMLGVPPASTMLDPLDLDYVGVKAPQFSFRRIEGADPTLRVEMASTGEVGCLGRTADEALVKAMLSVGFRYPTRGVLLSLGPMREKYRFTREAQLLAESGLRLYATAGTADVLEAEGVPCVRVSKGDDTTDGPSSLALLENGDVDLVVNVAREYDAHGLPDGARIRRLSVDLDVPLITDLMAARAIVGAMLAWPIERLEVKPWRAYLRETNDHAGREGS